MTLAMGDATSKCEIIEDDEQKEQWEKFKQWKTEEIKEKEDEQCLREHTLKVREEEVARKEKSLQDKSAEGISMELLTVKDQVMQQLKEKQEQELRERKLSLREEEIGRKEKSLKRYWSDSGGGEEVEELAEQIRDLKRRLSTLENAIILDVDRRPYLPPVFKRRRYFSFATFWCILEPVNADFLSTIINLQSKIRC